jgi:hypothetical protein
VTGVHVGQHGGFVVLINLGAALRANEPRAVHKAGVGVALVVKMLQHQLVQVVAVRARGVIGLFGAHLIQLIDL